MKTFYDWRDTPVELPEGQPISWRISTYAVITNDKQQLLLVKPYGDTLWEFPGGGADIHETLIEALVRETQEETGYTVEPIDTNPFYVGEAPFHGTKKKEFFHAIHLFYKVRIVGDQDRNRLVPGEIETVAWYDLKKINVEQCRSIIRPVLSLLLPTSTASTTKSATR